MIYELADPCNTTIDVWVNCAIGLGREGPGTCFTLTGLLRVKLCLRVLYLHTCLSSAAQHLTHIRKPCTHM